MSCRSKKKKTRKPEKISRKNACWSIFFLFYCFPILADRYRPFPYSARFFFLGEIRGKKKTQFGQDTGNRQKCLKTGKTTKNRQNDIKKNEKNVYDIFTRYTETHSSLSCRKKRLAVKITNSLLKT